MSEELTNAAMSEEEIAADLDTFENEPVPDIAASLAKKEAVPADSSPREQATTGEASAEEEDAGKPGSEGDAEPKTEEVKAETWTDAQGRVHDTKTGRILPKTDAPAAEKAGEAAPESNFTKKQKEIERQKSVLSGFEEEKRRVREEQDRRDAELRERERQLELKAQEQNIKKGERRRDAQGNPIYSSEEYRDAINGYKAAKRRGEDTDPSTGIEYDTLIERAELALDAAQAREAQERQQFFENRRTELALEVLNTAGNEELKNTNSPLAKDVQSVFAEEMERSRKHGRPSIFSMVPDGFELAVEVAKLRRQAASADEWKSKYEEAQKEIDRLNEATQVESSTPTMDKRAKSLEEMSGDEGMAELDREFEAAGGKLFSR